jgi:hypothetical protein
MTVFEEEIFPLVHELVKPGGRFAGYIPVFQGDSAGPHRDAKFRKFVLDFCKSKGWLWHDQGPQMPHANTCDLSIFPAISRSHSHLLRCHGSTVASVEAIKDAADVCWRKLTSADIARSFVLAYRIMRKVIAAKGSNTFLCEDKLHSQVRKDYLDTATGVRRRNAKARNASICTSG